MALSKGRPGFGRAVSVLARQDKHDDDGDQRRKRHNCAKPLARDQSKPHDAPAGTGLGVSAGHENPQSRGLAADGGAPSWTIETMAPG